MVQSGRLVVVLPREPQVIFDRVDDDIGFTKGAIPRFPDSGAVACNQPLWGSKVVVLIEVDITTGSTLEQRFSHPRAVRRKLVFFDEGAVVAVFRREAFAVVEVPGGGGGFFDALPIRVVAVFADDVAVYFYAD
jgi:hypothetical protein